MALREEVARIAIAAKNITDAADRRDPLRFNAALPMDAWNIAASSTARNILSGTERVALSELYGSVIEANSLQAVVPQLLIAAIVDEPDKKSPYEDEAYGFATEPYRRVRDLAQKIEGSFVPGRGMAGKLGKIFEHVGAGRV